MPLIMTLALIAFATPQDAPTTDPADAKAAKLVCKATGVTGSRVRSAKVCRTRAEWTALEEASRKRADQYRDTQRTQPWQ